MFYSLISCLFVLLAVLCCADGFGIAEMVSNYAKVTTNSDGIIKNQTDRVEKSATSEYPVLNETDYEDFDDLEESTEDSVSRQTMIDSTSMMKYINGFISLLTLMYKFSGNSGWQTPKRRIFKGGDVPGEPRYQSGMDVKNFHYESDLEKQPIGNYPPYNPLTANIAETYPNGGKNSYDSDRQQFKIGANSMSEYATQNDNSFEQHQKPEDEWNSISQDYPVYNPSDTWSQQPDPKPRNQWKPQEYPVFHHPDHDFVLSDVHLEDHHHLPDDEDRESKRPYSYYFLGRKLWYIPLIFSVYYIIYIGALVLKSVARHKIQFPDKLWDIKEEHYKHRRYRKIDEATEKYENAIENAKYKFM